MDNYSQTDIWQEVLTDNLAQAAEYCKEHQLPRRDEIETQTKGFWISDPAGTILRIGEK